jgi:16S rRNA (cytosine967-C5)-methyltransferase
MRAKQASILAAASKLVAPKGRLVYATCSILRTENEAIVEAFLAEHPAFVAVDAREVLKEQGIEVPALEGPWLKLRPDVHATDGFFAAVLERKTDDAK